MSQIDDGGPAFPQSIASTGSQHVACSDDPGYGPRSGMTLRDHFAAAALPAVMREEDWDKDAMGAARKSYFMADAMLEARKPIKPDGL